MKVSCLQENMAKGLSIVSRAVATKSTLPVLGNVKLETDQGRLKLSATNLELGITTWIGAKIEEEGATTVPARILADFVNSLPNDRIDMALTVRTHTLNLRCARFEANIKGLDAQEFPLIPEVSDTPTVVMDAALLREMVAQVAFAAATDDSRPVLTGVLCHFEDSSLTFVAADGFRLSVRKTQLKTASRERLDVIIPARTLQEVARIATDDTEGITITVTPNRSQVLFHTANADIVSRLIDGTFPNYQAIIPDANNRKTRTIVSSLELIKATKIASFFARDAANIVRLNITPGEDITPGRLVVSANAAEVGDNVGEIDARVEGEPVLIAFNARYLLEVLGVIPAGDIALDTSSSTSPGVIQPLGFSDFLHVIMPMHLR